MHTRVQMWQGAECCLQSHPAHRGTLILYLVGTLNGYVEYNNVAYRYIVQVLHEIHQEWGAIYADYCLQWLDYDALLVC